MKVKQWKNLEWFAKELKLGIDFSCDILRKDKVSIKRARTEKVMKTEDEAIMALLWEQIVIDNFVGCSWGNVSRIKWQHQCGEKREDGDNVENSTGGVCCLDTEANRFTINYSQTG